MAGERGAVAGIVGGVMEHRRAGKPDTVQKREAEQRGEQRGNPDAGSRRGAPSGGCRCGVYHGGLLAPIRGRSRRANYKQPAAERQAIRRRPGLRLWPRRVVPAHPPKDRCRACRVADPLRFFSRYAVSETRLALRDNRNIGFRRHGSRCSKCRRPKVFAKKRQVSKYLALLRFGLSVVVRRARRSAAPAPQRRRRSQGAVGCGARP